MAPASTLVVTCSLLIAPVDSPRSIPLLQLAAHAGIESPSVTDSMEGALYALQLLAEDNAAAFEEYADAMNSPLERIIPRLVQLLAALPPASPHRRATAKALDFFAGVAPVPLDMCMPSYLAALSSASGDPSADIRVAVIHSFGTLANRSLVTIEDALPSIVEYMLTASADTRAENEPVTLAALEFWDVLAESIGSAIPDDEDGCDYGDEDDDDDERGANGGHGGYATAAGSARRGADALATLPPTDPRSKLAPYMDRLVAMLLTRMVYTSDQLAALPVVDVADASVPDKPSDVLAIIFRPEQGVDSAYALGGAVPLAEGDEEDPGGDGSDPNADVKQWNVRNAAAAALESLGLVFGDALLPTLLPQLQVRLAATGDAGDAWLHREAAVLAIALLWRGCSHGLGAQMPSLFPYLLATLADTRPLLRDSTCYALGCVVDWICEAEAEHPGGAAGPSPMHQLIAAFVPRLLDHNKKAQTAAIVAIGEIVENAREHVEPYVGTLVAAFLEGFKQYQLKSRVYLYDTIQSTCVALSGGGPEVAAALAHLLPILAERAVSLPLDDPELACVIDVVADLAPIVQARIAPVAGHLLAKCITMAERDIVSELAAAASSAGRASGASAPAGGTRGEVARAALHCVSGVIEAVGDAIADLIAATNLVDILFMCAQPTLNEYPKVQQAGILLVGDMAIYAARVIAPHVASFMPLLIASMIPRPLNVNVCNNALWATAELLRTLAVSVLPFGQQVFDRAAAILAVYANAPGLLENAAVLVGRLASANPQLVAPRLLTVTGAVDAESASGRLPFLGDWAMAVSRVRFVSI